MKWSLAGFVVLFCLVRPASAAWTVSEKDGWKFTVGGFVEIDSIHDSTRSLTEIPQNVAIARADNINAMAGRTQFSIRNSRLAFGLEAPEQEGWKARGYYEMDFLGFDPSPTSPSSTSSLQNEGSFFNNPTMRTRHVYLSAESNGWQLLAGQTWNLFGWQPYYFMPTIEVSPVAGMAYNRTAQFRAVKTATQTGGNILQTSLIIARPPQRDAQMPDLEAGVRYAMVNRVSGFTGGSSGAEKNQPMSVGLSGLWRKFKVPYPPGSATGDQEGYNAFAVAVDALFPLIPSLDGKDVSNTLTLGGELTYGKGYADQMGGFTGGLPNPLTNNSNTTVYDKATNLDAGQGDFDTNGNFSLVRLRTWNLYMQYHLAAELHTWMSFGYSQLSALNITNYINLNTGKLASGSYPYNKDENYFLNVMHDFTGQLRMGVEYAYMQTTYSDGTKAPNDRYQVNAFYLF